MHNIILLLFKILLVFYINLTQILLQYIHILSHKFISQRFRFLTMCNIFNPLRMLFTKTYLSPNGLSPHIYIPCEQYIARGM